jgi:hypothetical protein
VFSLEQLLAAHQEEERAKELNVLPVYDLPVVPAGVEHPKDLLDLEEARQALPEERRVSRETWRSYRYGGKTKLPDPDFTLDDPDFTSDGVSGGGGTFWRRETILNWDAERPRRGKSPNGGRPLGSKDKQPRTGYAQAQERRQRVRQLLDQDAGVSAQVLAEDLGVHQVSAERLLREARIQKVRELLEEQPALTVDEVMAVTGMRSPSRAGRLLVEAGGSAVS